MKGKKGRVLSATAAGALMLVGCATTAAQPAGHTAMGGSPCWTPPRYECPDAKDCNQTIRTFLGEATEFNSQRSSVMFPSASFTTSLQVIKQA
jgi:hypothetical protein